MKKFLFVILILLLGFGGYLLYDTKFREKIPVLEIEEEVIQIDELFIYGTHLNLHGNIVEISNIDLVLYNGEFIPVEINITDNGFNLSDNVNDGLYLDEIPRGSYYLFLRKKEISSDEKEVYRYYALNNISDYKETIYYTFSNFNNKIIINSEESYPTMMINVLENKDKDVYDIVIDAGHGGMDSGAVKNGQKESDLTLDLATMLKEKLEEYDFKVKLTHEEGTLSLQETMNEYGEHGRAVIPYEVNAKYTFSLHMNSNDYSSVNGLEVYTAKNINYDLAKLLVENITSITGLKHSNNKINKIFDSIYTRNFTEEEINKSNNEKIQKNLEAYDITTNANYYYMIRETGGIVTGAYVDDRNEEILGNPYVDSNVGSETYLLELGYISNKSDLNNMINNMDKYAEAIAKSIQSIYKVTDKDTENQ